MATESVSARCIPHIICCTCTDQTKELRAVNWGSPPDYLSVHESIFFRATEGTCQWILEHPQFQQWVAGGVDQRTLWLHRPRTYTQLSAVPLQLSSELANIVHPHLAGLGKTVAA